MKKIMAMIVVLAFALVGLVGVANATEGNDPEPCVPAEAYTDYTEWVTESPGEGWYQTDEKTVVDTPGRTESTGWVLSAPEDDSWVLVEERTVTDKEAYTEPSTFEKTFYVLRGWDKEEAPTVDSPGWKSNPGSHNGHPDYGPNTPYTTGNDDPENPKSRNWFYYSITEIPGEHHEAETHKEYRYEREIPPVPHVEYIFAFDHEAVTCDDSPVENKVVTPNWKVEISCFTPRSEWVTAESTDEYTATVNLSRGLSYEIEFVANDGYEFETSDKYVLSDDSGRAVVTGMFPALRCVVPEEPTKPSEPKPSEPKPSEPKSPVDKNASLTASIYYQCAGSDMMVRETDANGNSSTSYITGHPACATDEPVNEEGF